MSTNPSPTADTCYMRFRTRATMAIMALMTPALLTSCSGSAVPSGTNLPCSPLATCLARVNSIDGGVRLMRFRVEGFQYVGGSVTHNALAVEWGLTLSYRNSSTGETLLFIAQPATAVTPWCPAPGVPTPSFGREVCLVAYSTLGSAAFVEGSVRYSVSTLSGAIPPLAQLSSDLLHWASRIY